MNNNHSQTVREFIESKINGGWTVHTTHRQAVKNGLIKNLGDEPIDKSLNGKLEKWVNGKGNSKHTNRNYRLVINDLMTGYARVDKEPSALGRPATLEESGLHVQHDHLEVMRLANASTDYGASQSHSR